MFVTASSADLPRPLDQSELLFRGSRFELDLELEFFPSACTTMRALSPLISSITTLSGGIHAAWVLPECRVV